MTFGNGLAFVYRASWAFIRKAWWLVPLPIVPILLWEFVAIYAPVAEYVPEGVEYLAIVLSAVLLVASTYWTMRFLALSEDVSAALSVNRQSASSFAPYFVCLTVFWCGVYVIPETGSIAELLTALLTTVVQSLLAPWSVSAPSGSKSIGPATAIRVSLPKLPWSVCFISVALLPFFFPFSLLENLLLGANGNPWLETVFGVALLIVVSIAALASNVAIFVVARRAGVRISDKDSLERIFD